MYRKHKAEELYEERMDAEIIIGKKQEATPRTETSEDMKFAVGDLAAVGGLG